MPKTSTMKTKFIALVGSISFATMAVADAQKINVPAGDLIAALQSLAKQVDIDLVYQDAQVKGLRTEGVSGNLSPQEALVRLLKGTSLTIRKDKISGAILITPASLTAPQADATSDPLNANLSASSAADAAGFTQLALLQDEKTNVSAGESDAKGTKSKATHKENNAVEEMIVENTKIAPFSDANVDLPRTINDPQAYYIFDSKEIERSGALTIEDFLRRRLTMDTTYQTSSEIVPLLNSNLANDPATNAGLAGTNISSFNLRGLGANKTLILINGRRVSSQNFSGVGGLGMYSGEDRQADLNGIPMSSIDRIEVLPSSASAIYGGNAIGGVINVVLKRSYQGGDLRVTFGAPSNSSSHTASAGATYGFSLEQGKSQVMLSAQYSEAEPMILGDRAEFAEKGLEWISTRYRASQNATTGVITHGLVGLVLNSGGIGPTGTHIYWTGNKDLKLKDGTVVATEAAPGLRMAYIKPGTTTATPMAERFVSFGPEMLQVSPGFGTWGKSQPLGANSETTSFGASLNRKMNTWLELFADVRRQESRSTSTNTSYSISITNTANPTGINPFDSSITSFRYSSKTSLVLPVTSLSQTYSVTAGLKGSFSNGWAGELSFTRTNNRFEGNYYDYPYQRNPFKYYNLDIYLSKVPGGDPFIDPYTFNYDPGNLIVERHSAGNSSNDEIALRMAGPFFHFPWGDPTVSVGLNRNTSFRPGGKERYFYELFGSPLLGFVPSLGRIEQNLDRSTTNDALYVEASIPLVTAKNAIPLLRAIEMQVAQRMSRSQAQTGTDYIYQYLDIPGVVTRIDPPGGIPIVRDASYSSNNETLAIKYQPIESITLRASVGTAFIPPTYYQLIPDKTLVPNGTTIDKDPVTLLPSYTADYIYGGNPDLRPQRSSSKDLGLIYQPLSNVLKGLRVNIQWYQISQFDFIGSPPMNELLTLPQFASRVIRDPDTMRVTQVDLSYINLAESSSSGLDVAFSYNVQTGWGNWDFSLAGTKMLYERRRVSDASPLIDYAGFPGRGGSARYKANANLGWSSNGLALGWTTSWFGNYRLGGSPGDPWGYSNFPNTEWVLQGSFSVPAQMYHHVFAGYDFGKQAKLRMLSGVSMQLNIQNVLNTLPPLDAMRPPFYLSPYGSYRLRDFSFSVKKSF